jgi:hypothetical protein
VRLTLVVTAAALVLAACGSGYQYAKRVHPKLLYRTGGGSGAVGIAQVEAASTYFKLPPKWRLLEEEDYLQQTGILSAGSPEGAYLARNKQRVQPFDAAPRPSIINVLQPTGSHPSGFSAVYVLDDEERDNVSLRSLRNAAINIDPDPLSGNSNAEVLLHDDAVVRPGGFHGNRVIANVRASNGALMTLDKTTLVDEDTRVVYMFVVACEARCFRQQQKTIAEVVDSWTIKER